MPSPIRLGLTAIAFSLTAVAAPSRAAPGPDPAAPLSPEGCADRSREGFVDIATYPTIASCGGAWNVPGAFHDAPVCARAAGNDGVNEAGAGCNVEDLCADGWHVCFGPDDIATRTGGRGCVDAVAADYPNHGSGQVTAPIPPGGAFFMTRTSGSGTGNCDEVVNGFPQSFNDIFGCGTMGTMPQANCTPLNRFGHNQCSALQTYNAQGYAATAFGYNANEWAWFCNDGANGTNESKFVVKTRADDQGGVLCCKDSDVTLPEVCDGRDNDADGVTDEVDFVHDGSADQLPGDPCTATGVPNGTIACAGDGSWTCVPVPPEACCYPDGRCGDVAVAACASLGGSPSGPGTGCASAPCKAVSCTGSCDDGNPCTSDSCVAGQCVHAPNAFACSDGDACTGGDQCARGLCVAGPKALCNCGNGRLDAGEGCDDGNLVSGDGCDVACVIEKRCAEGADVDHDGICDDGDDCVDADLDGYGVGPGCVGPDCNDTVASCTTDCVSDTDGSDGNGIPDCEEAVCVDTDSDGYGEGSACNGPDCDDGVASCNVDCADADRDTLRDCDVDSDDDNDKLPDAIEAMSGTDRLDVDSDDDGIGDGDEVITYATDPTMPDSDGDGLGDGVEVAQKSDPKDPTDTGAGAQGEAKASAGCQTGADGATAALLAGLALAWVVRRRA